MQNLLAVRCVRMRKLLFAAIWLGTAQHVASPAALAQDAAVRRAATARELVGLWTSETVITPLIAGALTIDARGPTWTATVAGRVAPVRHERDSVVVNLPGGAGEFRGRWDGTGIRRLIRGHWVQPGALAPYEQRYASPVVLSSVAANVWRGLVRPLEPKVTFYLSIQTATDGRVDAFIRNPEANYFADRRYVVATQGDSVTLQHANVPEAGTYDAERDQLLIPLLFGYPPLVFSRSVPASAGFFARGSGAARYEYRPPIAEGDGWTVASLADVGMDAAPITRLIDRILTSTPSPDDTLNIHSLLIARHGRLVLEEYFHGFDKDRLHDMRSASKSITSVLIGIAGDRGVRIGPNTLAAPLLQMTTSDERKRRITVGDFLHMTSGLDIDDANPSSRGEEGRMWRLKEQPDFCRYAFELPMVRDPGSNRPIYGSASTNLAGCALRAATGRWLPELFDEYFARPLEITRYAMNLMPNGEAYAGGGLYMRPRDQLKLGQLFLLRGRWNNKQVVSDDWVRRSTVRRGDMTPRIDSDVAHGYGYAWHFREGAALGRTISYYWAGGNGGQLIIVVPALDMVVGFTGGDYAQARKYLRWEIEEMPRYIFPAVIK
jgi:CubicO group peptidase (beta-lactamase class C family)